MIRAVDTDGEKVSLDAILEAVGYRSFGPLLLVAGVITLAPIIGDIPGMPTLMGVFVFMLAGQMLLQRERLWLPQWLLERSVRKKRLHKGLAWLRRPARLIDRWVRPRLTLLVQGAGRNVIAVVCLIVALAMPVMEFVPFSANGAGGALTAFGLSLTARDGLLALLALAIILGTFGAIAYRFL